jgi:hypothetical protein
MGGKVIYYPFLFKLKKTFKNIWEYKEIIYIFAQTKIYKLCNSNPMETG